MAEAFHVQRSVEVIARVRVPPAIAARDHDEKFALRGTPNPQRQPKVGVFADPPRVPMFTRNWSKLHKADLGGGRAALSHLLESIAPHCQFVRTELRGVKPLILEPALERAQIVFTDEIPRVRDPGRFHHMRGLLTCGPQSGRTSAPIRPQRVHTMRWHSERTGVSSGSQSAFIVAL